MKKTLFFGGKNHKPDIRKLKDFKEVIYDKKWLEKTPSNFEAYFMYRGLAKNKEDKEKMEKAGLRYDITIIPSKSFGLEFPKTMGHYHSFPLASSFSYPEVYEVLSGKAMYLLQKIDDDKITKITAIKANKGDKVIVPPNYGHITVNVGKIDLKMSNWQALATRADYKSILDKKGGAYFAIKLGGNRIKLIKNENYGRLPEIKFSNPANYFFQSRKTTYDFVDNLEKLEFLKNPSKFKNLWNRLEE